MIRRFGVALAALALAGGTVALPASADDSVDGAESHLPALAATSTYYAGSSLAEQVRAYRASGRYVSDRTAIAKKAQTFFDDWMRTSCSDADCRPAIVFDFDDTLVSWYSVLDSTDFTSNPAVSGPAMNECLTPPIHSTMNLLEHAQRRGAQVFVITGRTESSRAVTEACLAQIGANDVRLILRDTEQQSLTAVDYKSQERARLEKAGWDIALSIGDQVSDVAGGHTAAEFVVPNPMYFIP